MHVLKFELMPTLKIRTYANMKIQTNAGAPY